MNEVHVVVPQGVDDPRRPSGGNTYDRRLCRGLTGLGWRVHEHAVPAPEVPGRAAPAAGLGEVLAGLPADAVVLLDGLVASACPLLLVRTAGRLRLVVLVHLPLGLAPGTGEEPQVRAGERAALHGVAAVVTTSRWCRRWLLATYHLPPSRVAVAVPGVDRCEAVRPHEGGRRLLCVGAVIPGKGQDVLVEALARLSRQDWTCRCVGALDVDPAFAGRVRDRVLALGMADRVTFPGPVVGAALDAVHAGSDLLVTASRGETYAMVVTEALARGTPVVATRVGGLPEALGRAPGGRRPGILVPAEDPAALADALERWLGDADLRARLREAASARRPTLPTWEATSTEVARVLAQVAA